MPHSPSEPSSVAQRVRFGWNLINLSTPVGLLVAGLGRARLRCGPRALVFAERYVERPAANTGLRAAKAHLSRGVGRLCWGKP